MRPDPTLHPHLPEIDPETAIELPCGEDVAEGGVMGMDDEPNDEPNNKPCTPAFDMDEARDYGGIPAMYLAVLVVSLLKRRIRHGVGHMIHHLCKESVPVRQALYIYTRVKAALRTLSEPVGLEICVTETGAYVPRYPLPACDTVLEDRDNHKDREITSAEWTSIDAHQGYDVRGTSMVWVERRVASVRANARRAAKRAFIKRKGLTRAKLSQPQLSERARQLKCRNAANAAYAQRVKDDPELIGEKPEPLAPLYGEIWPPVPRPDRTAVPVIVTAVPAVAPVPTLEEIDPVIGSEYAYAEVKYTHHTYIRDPETGWEVPVYTDPEKPP